jgi:ABC-type lipoprotein release transport system permease subunit
MNGMPYEWRLARRSLGGGGFLSFISMVALGGIALGVAVLQLRGRTQPHGRSAVCFA